MEMPRLADHPDVLDGVGGLVFDKDGTLTDLSGRWFAFFDDLVRTAADELGVDSADQLLTEIGVADGELIPNGLAAVGRSDEIGERLIVGFESAGACAEEVVAALRSAQRSASFGQLAPLGDIAASIDIMVRAGIRVGVATADGRTNTLEELDLLSIGHLVTAVRCGDDEGPKKPDGDVLVQIGRQWGIDTDRIVFVGDSHGDAMTARSAGVHFISVGRHTEADAWVETIDEIAALI